MGAKNDLRMTDAEQLLANLIIAEHQTFWSKFTAFSALNLGLIVLVLQTAEPSFSLLLIGLVLSVFWALIQWLSYHYVCYYGKQFDVLVRRLGVRPDGSEFWAGFIRPTLVAVFAVLLVLGFWVERIFDLTM